MEVIFIVGIVQHRIVVYILDLGHGAQVPGDRDGDVGLRLTLEAQQLTHLERLSSVAYEQLCSRPNRSLVDAKYTQLAPERVNRHLEHMAHHMIFRVRLHRHRRGVFPFPLQEFGRISL